MKYLWLMTLCLFTFGCGDTEVWETLFNGEDLQGWHVYGGGEDYNGWTVESGVLLFDPALRTEARTSNLITDKQYTNFELSLEWMISEQGNSGIFWGVVEDEQYEHPYQTGPEIQILDDNWSAYIEERGEKTRAGAIFAIQAPSPVVSKGAGEWNEFLLHIDQDQNEGFLEFNGQRVMEFPVNGEEWNNLVAPTHFADWEGFGKARTGNICLQDHGSRVAFRKVRIREF